MSKRYIVRRISSCLCELTYPTPEGPGRLVRYTRRDAGGYVWRDDQQAMEQGRNRTGHTLRCGARQDLAKLIRAEVKKSLAREQRELDESSTASLFVRGGTITHEVATLDEAGHP